MWRSKIMTINVPKQPPLVEDLRNHSQEQIAELRQLLAVGAPSRPDPRRPGFYEIEGLSNTYYVFKYPTGTKVLLLGVWYRQTDPVAAMVACSCPAAYFPFRDTAEYTQLKTSVPTNSERFFSLPRALTLS